MKDRPVRCAVLTISDTRTEQNDEGGQLARRLLTEAGCEIVAHGIVRDEPDAIAAQLRKWLADLGVDAIITTGGTGISRRDTTIDVVRKLLSIELEGFGELFRMISYEQVKAAAMMSRAVGGLVIRPAAQGGETFLFAVPGSANAVQTALSQLICPQLPHLVWERRKSQTRPPHVST